MRFSIFMVSLAILEHGNKLKTDPALGVILIIIGIILGAADIIEFLKKQ